MLDVDSKNHRTISELATSLWEYRQKVERLEKELVDTKQLLDGANITFDRIAKLVGYNGQYRDLIEAVEIKLTELNYAKSSIR